MARQAQTAGRNTELQILQESPKALIAGLDEAGRGPLAGPVCIGIAVFSPRFFASEVPEELLGLRDSKKISEARREAYLHAIQRHALFCASILVPAKLVDRLRINQAIEFAMLRALKRALSSNLNISHALLDGNYRFDSLYRAFPDTSFSSIKKGDDLVFTIAAASILSKTRRDKRMERYGSLFPGYDLDRHKGYGTAAHRQAIAELGPTPIHRRSYKW